MDHRKILFASDYPLLICPREQTEPDLRRPAERREARAQDRERRAGARAPEGLGHPHRRGPERGDQQVVEAEGGRPAPEHEVAVRRRLVGRIGPPEDQVAEGAQVRDRHQVLDRVESALVDRVLQRAGRRAAEPPGETRVRVDRLAPPVAAGQPPPGERAPARGSG